MYWQTVKFGNLEVRVPCTPDTNPMEILERAAKQVRAWRAEPDYESQGASIAFRHNIIIKGLIKIEKLQQRADEIGKWLAVNAPYCDVDQKHLDENTSERAYWHYGYVAALIDVLSSRPNIATEKK